MDNSKAITFLGSFAQKMNAIQIGPEITRLTIDVPKSEQHNAVALQALLETPLRFTVEAVAFRPSAQPKPKAKEPKGPYSFYWEYLRKQSIETWPDFQEALDCSIDHVWEALHQEFNVDTMAVIGPRQFEQWVRDKGMSEGLITLSKRAEAAAVEKTDKRKEA